jgi:hypothetical protein
MRTSTIPAIALFVLLNASAARAQLAAEPPPDVKPGSITSEDVPYPYPSSYLPLTL